MVELESLAIAQSCVAHVSVRSEILSMHGPKVLNDYSQVHSVRISEMMFEEHICKEVYRMLTDAIKMVRTRARGG
jgi:sulfur oxygenase/reductase